MPGISKYTEDLIASRTTDIDWVVSQIEGLQILFDNPSWDYTWSTDAPCTVPQLGHLAGVMDLERNDRLMCLEILTNTRLDWNNEPSSKDLGLTRWNASVLIEYYISGKGKQLNAKLGFTPLSVIREEKRRQRAIARENKAAERASKRRSPAAVPSG